MEKKIYGIATTFPPACDELNLIIAVRVLSGLLDWPDGYYFGQFKSGPIHGGSCKLMRQNSSI
uniref:Uncharacterized protein n=1 Tax=Romanomermis culicivorax TaxID=13658 RepID=A0A915JCZ5_ROMCU